MANTTTQKQNKLLTQMREILGEAYSMVRGCEYNKYMAAITYEQLVDEAIHKIAGTKDRQDDRENRIARIERIQKSIKDAVTSAKTQPVEYWRYKSDDQDIANTDVANTPE